MEEPPQKILEVALMTDEVTSKRYSEYMNISTFMLILGNIVSKCVFLVLFSRALLLKPYLE